MINKCKCNTKFSSQRNTSPWLALGAEYLALDFRMMFSWIWAHSLSLLHLQQKTGFIAPKNFKYLV
jgi:hypothetical protein